MDPILFSKKKSWGAFDLRDVLAIDQEVDSQHLRSQLANFFRRNDPAIQKI